MKEKRIVLYDSLYGNTEKVALAVAKSISGKAVSIENIKLKDLDNIDLLVVGSPTQGGMATKALLKFLNDIPREKLSNLKTAVFDTRLSEKEVNFALKLLIKTIGYAAPKMEKILTTKGAKIIAPSEGFFVKDKEGPLADKELQRAQKWLKI